MRVQFRTTKLRQLYESDTGSRRYPPEVVHAFFEAMTFLKAAADERDLYALKGFHFERLRGDRGRQGERSIRLNQQWRPILKIERDKDGKLLLLLDIERHYND